MTFDIKHTKVIIDSWKLVVSQPKIWELELEATQQYRIHTSALELNFVQRKI